MLPDFKQPAFSLVALSNVHFLPVDEGGNRYKSDYRCQLRYGVGSTNLDAVEVRVYFVGSESASAGTDVPVLLAFLDWQQEMGRCHEGVVFELLEGLRVTATGVVSVVAVRRG